MKTGHWVVFAGTLISALGTGMVYIGNVLLTNKDEK